MTTLNRGVFVTATLIAVFCTLSYRTVSQLIPGSNESELDLPAVDLDQEGRRRRDLDEQSSVALHRLYAKIDIVDDLLDGNMTLSEAAILFSRWNEQAPAVNYSAELMFPKDMSSGECLFRQTLQWAHLQFPFRPNCDALALERLDAEFSAHLQKNDFDAILAASAHQAP